MLEELSLPALCSQVKSPYYVYSENEIKNTCNEVLSLTQGYDVLPCYALKANFNPTIIKIIKEMGFGADVVSAGELHFAQKCGIAPEKIVFAGVGKTKDEIEQAISTGIHSLNIECDEELFLIEEVTKSLNKQINIAVRINPDISAQTHPYISTGLHQNKFGVTKEVALKIYQRALRNPLIIPSGIHVHIGSQINSVQPYIETAQYILAFLEELKAMDIVVEHIDLGGGIGINYDQQMDSKTTNRTYIKDILPDFLNQFKDLGKKLIIELGRSIVGSAGLLITKVLYVKRTPLKKFIIVDAAMNNLIRPSLYQTYHQIISLNRRGDTEEIVDVVGPVCETGDYFAKDIKLPPLRAGDYIAITAAGAYGQALSSNYNLRPMISEYLISGKDFKNIYKGDSLKSLTEKYSW
jgi:diaminopimelate decarboxylase